MILTKLTVPWSFFLTQVEHSERKDNNIHVTPKVDDWLAEKKFRPLIFGFSEEKFLPSSFS
jgi:hypothetical protein